MNTAASWPGPSSEAGASEARATDGGAQETLEGTVFVIDDERNIRRTLAMVLESEGAKVESAADAESAAQRLEGGFRPDVIVLDVLLPGISGLQFLEQLPRRLGEIARTIPVVMISGHASIQDALRATRAGAFDFLEKPLHRDRVLLAIRNALARSRSLREIEKLRREKGEALVGGGHAMRNLLEMVHKVGPTRARVLITGPSGSGKELIARAVHAASERRSEAFVKVNCAAIPQPLIESELFGYERGAFTGANQQKKGLFERAHGGTIFLDEIGDMDLEAQAKVLRVLQSGEFMRVGGRANIEVDVRVLAATHQDLPAKVSEGSFREDLYFRLAVVPLAVPPLSERSEDIDALVRHFVARSCAQNGVSPKTVSPELLASLRTYNWPGNVRELRNLVERMVVFSDGDLGLEDLPAELRSMDASAGGTGLTGGLRDLQGALVQMLSGTAPEALADMDLRSFREAGERALILAHLRAMDWNVSRAAEQLGVERTHLHRKLRALGIRRGEEG